MYNFYNFANFSTPLYDWWCHTPLELYLNINLRGYLFFMKLIFNRNCFNGKFNQIMRTELIPQIFFYSPQFDI